MKKHRYVIISCLFLALPAILCAQTAQRLEELLQTAAVSGDQAARFVLEAADRIGETGAASPAQAFNFAAEQKWLPSNIDAQEAIRLDALSLLVMQSFGMKGGLLYTCFKNPHYAYRELTYQGVILGKADPEMTVSGEMLLFLVNRALSLSEDSDTGAAQ